MGCFLADEGGLRDAHDLVKTKKLIAKFSILFLAALSAQAQGTFTNLDFESATVAPSGPEPYGTFVPIGLALPAWNAYLGSVQLTQVGYNSPTLGTATVSVFGPTFSYGIIDGNYDVDLQTGANLNASIEQMGTIPANAETLQFDAAETTPLTVTFNGNVLNPVALSSGVSADGQGYSVYGANIAAWENVVGELEFTADFNGSYNCVLLDDISFSTTAVSPEPSIVALTAIGGLLFGARKWFARR